jgi:hypothetical protein
VGYYVRINGRSGSHAVTAVTACGHGSGSTTVKVVALPIRFSGRNVNPVVTVVTPVFLFTEIPVTGTLTP